MKNIVIGWLFFLSGVALLGFSLWKTSDLRSPDAAPQATSPDPSAVPPDPAGTTPDPMVTADPRPGDPPANPPPGVDPPPADAMPAPDPMATSDATPAAPPNPDAVMAPEPATGMTPEPATALSEVLLVFDVRSQHISKQVKEEITNLAKGRSDASFKLEVAAGELGTADENEKLGKRRARAIRKILTDAGIPERKVSYKLILPGPADGEGEHASRQWRKATVRIAGGGK